MVERRERHPAPAPRQVRHGRIRHDGALGAAGMPETPDPAAHASGGGTRLLVALALNLGITIAQVIGGVLSGSLALLSDAAHNASDAAALGIAYGARRLARRPPDARFTFGYARAETVGAMINLTALIMIALYLLVQGVRRLSEPPDVPGKVLLIVGAIAFVEDLLSVWVLRRDMKGSLNVRSAVLHLIGDTASTVAVIVSGLLILWRGLTWVDPVLTIAISLYLLYEGGKELRKAARVLMDQTPPGLDVDALVGAIRAVDGVCDVRHVHVWRLDEHRNAVEACMAVAGTDIVVLERVKSAVKRMLHADFRIEHATLELELGPDVDARLAVDARLDADARSEVDSSRNATSPPDP